MICFIVPVIAEVTSIKLRPRTKRGITRFPGITADARQLGVSYRWLWQVVTGRQKSPRLMDAYQALKASQSASVTEGHSTPLLGRCSCGTVPISHSSKASNQTEQRKHKLLGEGQ